MERGFCFLSSFRVVYGTNFPSSENSMEFNPGHLDSLRKLGIIGEDETSLPPQELADRIARSNKIEDAVSDIRQELLNVMMALDVLGQSIDDVEEVLPDLTTREEVEQELAGFEETLYDWMAAISRIISMRDFQRSLTQILDTLSVEMNIETRHHLKVIEDNLGELPNALEELGQTKLRQGQAVLAALIRRLGELGG